MSSQVQIFTLHSVVLSFPSFVSLVRVCTFSNLPGYLYWGAQSLRSEVRLIFISCDASESSRQQSFEGLCMRGGRWGLAEGGLTRQTHRRYSKNFFFFFRVNWPSNEAVWGRSARTGEGWRVHFFFPSVCLSCPPMSRFFWLNPTLCNAHTSALLKQPYQVELSYCKCSPSGVSHFQGPHEHMRHSCETGRRKRGGGYMKQLENISIVHPV